MATPVTWVWPTVRVIPPLVIDDSHLDEFMEKLSAGAASYAPEAVPA